ncbi:MAG: hypothetical protein ABIH59_01015 [archaeon]
MVKKKEEKMRGGELGVVGFVFGILSIVFLASNGIILAILGFIFSYIQQKKNPTKLGKLGKTLSIIGFILSVILIILLLVFASQFSEQLVNFPVN